MLKDNRVGSPETCSVWSVPRRWPLLLSGTAGRLLRASTSYALNHALHHVGWALVYVHRSAGAKTLLYTPLLEPMLSLQNPHPPETSPPRDPAPHQSPGPPWRAPEGTGIGRSGAHSCRRGKRWPNRRAHTRWPSPLAPAP